MMEREFENSCVTQLELSSIIEQRFATFEEKISKPLDAKINGISASDEDLQHQRRIVSYNKLEEKLAETSRMIQPQKFGLKDCMPLLEDCVTDIVAVKRDLSHLTRSQRLLQDNRIKSNRQQTMLNASKEELSALRNRLDNLQSQLSSSNKKSQSQELRLTSVMEELEAVKNSIITEAEQQKVIRSQELGIKLLKLNVTALKRHMDEISLRLHRRQPSDQPSGQPSGQR